MNSQDFCTWLNGYVELGGSQPTQDQWEMIKEHLALVFNKTTRSIEEIKTQRLEESDRKRDQQLKWFEDLQKLGDYIAPRQVPPVVDGPTIVEPLKPWIVPDLPPTWTMPTTKPFEINNMPAITC